MSTVARGIEVLFLKIPEIINFLMLENLKMDISGSATKRVERHATLGFPVEL